jgi:type III HopA1-like effector protein
MAESLHAELLGIVAAIAFPSPGVVTLAGRYASNAGASPAMPGMTPAPNPLATQLQQLLYEGCYCRRFEDGAPRPAAAAMANPAFIEALSTANTSRERWDAGWQITQVLPSGQIVTVKGAMTRMVWPGEFVAQGAPGGPPRPGVDISLYAPKESRTMQPGFYFAFGEAPTDQEDEFSLVRLYWNLEATGAPTLIARVTAAFNRFAIPFRCKCLSMVELYQRTDAAVIYLAKRHYRLAAEMLEDIYRAVRPSLKPQIPLFTKALAPGLGLAENPKSGESFGMHRCRLLAEAVCAAHARGIDAPQARYDEIASAFAAAGLSLELPFLNPGSVDRYTHALGIAA